MKKLLLAVLMVMSLCAPSYGQAPAKPDLLEVVELSGEIRDFTAAMIAGKVEEISANPKIKAVLLVLDTPGGGVTASGVIGEELAKLKVPVVVWCQNVCASGGVWIAMAPSVKYIGVRAQTVGGSVGVIGSITRFNRLLDYLKIDNETYKSGSLKDAGNPTRASEEAERAYIQSIITAAAKEFYSRVEVSRGKKVSPAAWVEIKTAAIFVGADIVRVGLADGVLSKEAAYAKAKELSGSKTIYTRDELRKMSQVADERPQAHMMLPATRADAHGLGDVAALVEIVKEIRQGSTVRFEMRLPYQF